MNNNDLREYLADLCHRQWSGWMGYLFSKGKFNSDGTWTMPQWAVERWQRQMKTNYANLSDNEKDSDRNEADKFLELLRDRLLDGETYDVILAKAIELKQSDGKGWAIGDFIQEILEKYTWIEPDPVEETLLAIDIGILPENLDFEDAL